MLRILSTREHLIRPFADCTVVEACGLLTMAWQFIEHKKSGVLPPNATWGMVAGDGASDLVVYKPGDVDSQRGHVELIREALRWFAQALPSDAIVQECHPTQSDGRADLWAVEGKNHFICEVTDKRSWDNFAKIKVNHGRCSGVTKRQCQIGILRKLRGEIERAAGSSAVRTFHVLREDVAACEARRDFSKLMDGSEVLVEFDASPFRFGGHGSV